MYICILDVASTEDVYNVTMYIESHDNELYVTILSFTVLFLIKKYDTVAKKYFARPSTVLLRKVERSS
jgi:hypothetical protein